MLKVIWNNLIVFELNKVLNVNEIVWTLVSEDEMGYNSFWEKFFKKRCIPYWEKVEKVEEYWYNITDGPLWKWAFKSDMRTALFWWEKFWKVYTNGEMYILTWSNWEVKHIFCKDMQTKMNLSCVTEEMESKKI